MPPVKREQPPPTVRLGQEWLEQVGRIPYVAVAVDHRHPAPPYPHSASFAGAPHPRGGLLPSAAATRTARRGVLARATAARRSGREAGY